jgi:predicted dehydrogenase
MNPVPSSHVNLHSPTATMPKFNRRSFLKSTALSAAACSFPSLTWAGANGANDAIRVGIVGFGGRGGDHISGLRRLESKGVRIVALCDCDRKILAAGVESFTKRDQKVTGYTDVRSLIDAKDVDAITLATPNHWHALPTIWACQAGKDVYVEKPVSHNVWEGRQAVLAARKYKRIVQTGTQCRSSQGIRQAVEWVQAGNLGKILVARGLCYKARRSIGKVSEPQPIPPDVDYDLWCGPAPMAPLQRSRLHYDWHWVWDTGNGDLGNQGIHQMDIARWFLGEHALSPAVFSLGGRLGYDDDGQTPNTQFVFHNYANAPLIFEVRGLPRASEFQTDKAWSGNMDKFMRAGVGVIIHCQNGHVLVPDYSSAIAYDLNGREIQKWSGATDHYENFIHAVRTRNVNDLTADILEGHLSSALCHTGNVSHLLGTQTTPQAIREALRDEKAALETYERMAAHLFANGVDLNTSQLTLGPVLTMNPAKETFRNNKDANELLSRPYRKPFVVPKNV